MYYTPEEIRQIFDEYQRHRALNIPVSKELAERVRDASAGIKDYTYQLETSLNQLKSAGVGLFNKFKDGKQGASVYNDSMRAGADLLSTFLKALGPLGVMLGFVVKASVEYVAAANEQSDALFDGYTQLTKFGAGFDTGLDGVYRTAQQLGYSTRELDKFVGLVGRNRLVFPMFRGTVSRGVVAYGDLAESLRVHEKEFLMLGMTIDDVNVSVANYLQIQTMTGRSQTQILHELTRGAYNYILQQQLVTRLTGENAESQRTAQEQMANNAVFQVAQRELRLKHQAALAADDPDEAARLEQQFKENQLLIRMAPEGARKAFMEMQGGFLSASEDVQKAFLLMPEATRMVMAQRYSAIDILQMSAEETGKTMDQMGNLAGVGAFDSVYLPYSTARDLDRLITKQSLAARQEQVLLEMQRLQQLGTDEEAYVKMLMEQRRTREAAEDAINFGVPAATSSMARFTEIAHSASEKLAKAAGIEIPSAETTRRNATASASPPPASPPPAAAPPAATASAAAAPGSVQLGTVPRGSEQALLDLIGRVESRGNYNILVGGRTEPDLTSMTVSEVLQFQRGMVSRGHESTAVGKYQIIQPTLQGLVNNRAVSLDDTFSPATQDRLAITLLNGRGYQRYLQGAMTVHEFADQLAQEFASFPMPDGTSAYAGVGSNKALVDRNTVISTLQGYRFGGIAEGPDSEYAVELHGTEAVIPLPDGRSVPVDMPDFSAGVRAQTDAIAEQNSRLDDLIAIMRTRNHISEKILRAYQS